MATIRFRRGINNNRAQVVPASGEPLWTTDTKKLFVGDGTTPGGIPVCPYETAVGASADSLVAFSDATGFKLKPIAKATLLADYYTAAQVDAKEAAIKGGNVASATVASNSTLFGGEAPAAFVKQSQVTQSYTEATASKVASAAALAAAHTDLDAKIAAAAALANTKVAKTDISVSISSDSQTTVAASVAVKSAYDLASAANTKGTQGIVDAATAKTRADQAYTLAQTAQGVAQAAQGEAQAARAAPDLPIEQKRRVTYGIGNPVGGAEGDLYVQY